MNIATPKQRVILDAAAKALLPAARTQNAATSAPQTDPRHHNQKDLQMRSFIEPDSTLSQLDRQLRELTREHGHVLTLDEFRRHLDEHGNPSWLDTFRRDLHRAPKETLRRLARRIACGNYERRSPRD